MKNYRLRVTLNSWKTSGMTEKVESIYLNPLGNDWHNITEMCKAGVMSYTYDESSCYDEYQDFFFQSENSIEACRIGLDHYFKQDLEKVREDNIELLFLCNTISYKQAKEMSEEDVKACIKKYSIKI